MRTVRYFGIALIAFSLQLSVAVAGTIPSQTAPDGFKSYDDPTGARIIVGDIGQSSSIKDAFTSAKMHIRGYFDAPQMVKAVESKDGSVLIVAFKASLQGDKVVGLALVKYQGSADSRLDVLYGEPKTFIPNVKAILTDANQDDVKAFPAGSSKTASKSSSAGGSSVGIDISKYDAASKKVSLTKSTSSDGTITIGLASGFTTKTFGTSECVATSDDGALFKYDAFIGALDPRSSVGRSLGRSSAGGVKAEYDPDPVTAWKNLNKASAQMQNVPDPDIQISHEAPLKNAGKNAAQAVGTFTSNGQQMAFTVMMSVTPPSQLGTWNMTVTLLASPSDHIPSDAPKLLAMLKSAHLNSGAIAQANKIGYEQLAETQREMNQANAEANVLTSETQGMMDSSDRATAGFCNNLLGNEVVTDSYGNHATVSNDVGDLLTNADSDDFSEVPLSGYESGVDY